MIRETDRQFERDKKNFHLEEEEMGQEKKLINRGKETGKRTHSNANTRITARDSSFGQSESEGKKE